MRHSRRNTFLFGAAGGAIIAVGALALAIGRTALGSVGLVNGTATIEATSGALYLLVLAAATLSGLLIGAIGYGTGVTANPEAERFPLRYLLPVAAVTAALLAYAMLRIGIGAFGEIRNGMVTIGALRLTLIVLVMGVVVGGITAIAADGLAHPALFSFEGEAWPRSGREVVMAMMSAIGAPIMAIVAGAAFAIPLSIVLIELSGNAAVAFFSIVGAVILGGATLIAAHPWDRNAS